MRMSVIVGMGIPAGMRMAVIVKVHRPIVRG